MGELGAGPCCNFGIDMEATVGCLNVKICCVYSSFWIFSSGDDGPVDESSDDSPINAWEEFYYSCLAVD